MTRTKLTAGFIAFIVVASGIYAWNVTQSTTPASTKQPAHTITATPVAHASQPARSLSPSEPKRLQIASLNIDTTVVPTGQTKSGEMQSPEDRSTTGWYKYGYLPGSLGNAVIAGHSWHTQGRGVFASLDTIKPGGTIRLTTDTNLQEYTVTEIKTFDGNHPLTEDIFGASTKARLNLVTCTGAWDKEARRYKDRLVVFSEFAREQPADEPKP